MESFIMRSPNDIPIHNVGTASSYYVKEQGQGQSWLCVVLTSLLQRARVIEVSHSSALLAYNEKQIEFDWMEAAPGDCGQALFSGGFLFDPHPNKLTH
jgi:hypothetical protein